VVTADIIGQFIEKARVAGAEVVEFATAGEAADYLAGVVSDIGSSQAIAASDLADDPRFGTVLAGVPTRLAEGDLWVETGIIKAHYGIAETGTIVCFDEDDAVKNVASLPEVCYALLDAGRIVDRLEDLAANLARHLGRTDIPSPQVSLITGPSRTADIESEITIGVHGPRRLVILKYGDISLITPEVLPRRSNHFGNK
jgi:hypothetical protein